MEVIPLLGGQNMRLDDERAAQSVLASRAFYATLIRLSLSRGIGR
jgi:hypothetical protein